MKKLLYLICLLSFGQIFSAHEDEESALAALLMLGDKQVDFGQTNGQPAAKGRQCSSAGSAQFEDSESSQGEDEEFICKYCGKDLNSRRTLKAHEQTCDKRPDSSKKSKKILIHYPNNECPYCHKRYKKESYLRNTHITQCQKNLCAERTHVCEVGQCGYSGFTRNDLREHKKTCPFVREDKLRRSICPDCHYQYSDKYSLETHRKRCRENVENWLGCYKCGEKFKNREQLFNHFENCRPNPLEIKESIPQALLKKENDCIKTGLEKLRQAQFNSAFIAQAGHLELLKRQLQEAHLQQQQQQQLEQVLSQQQ